MVRDEDILWTAAAVVRDTRVLASPLVTRHYLELAKKRPLNQRPYCFSCTVSGYLLAKVDISVGTTVDRPSDCHICIPPL